MIFVEKSSKSKMVVGSNYPRYRLESGWCTVYSCCSIIFLCIYVHIFMADILKRRTGIRGITILQTLSNFTIMCTYILWYFIYFICFKTQEFLASASMIKNNVLANVLIACIVFSMCLCKVHVKTYK